MTKVALEINGPITDPERFIADLRKHAPHLFTDGKAPEPDPSQRVRGKRPAPEVEPLLTPAETAERWKVDVKTLTRWADRELIHCVRTPGNHRRFYEREVEALMHGRTWEPPGGWPKTLAA